MIRAVKVFTIGVMMTLIVVSLPALAKKQAQPINKTPFIQCNDVCRHELQMALNHDRLHNKMKGSFNEGEQMSISLPGAHGLQSPMNFYSGYATTYQKNAVGERIAGGKDKRIDLFSQGSITKSYVTAILLQLVQAHKLKLSDPIKKFFNDRYVNWDQITIKQLLNMTSGIVNYTDTDAFNQSYIKPYHRWKADQMIAIAYQNKKPVDHCKRGGNLCFKPGTQYMYSNTAYLLVGKIIEKVTGHSLSDEMQYRLLGARSKLGQLNNTYYTQHYSPIIWRRLVHGYGVWMPDFLPGDHGLKRDYTLLNMFTTVADGGNISNAEDILKWARLLLQTNLVINKTQEKQLKQLICNDRHSLLFGRPVKALGDRCKQGYGLGIFKKDHPKYGLMWTYEGENVGYASVYYLFKRSNIGIAIQRSSGVNLNFKPLLSTIMKILNHTREQKVSG